MSEDTEIAMERQIVKTSVGNEDKTDEDNSNKINLELAAAIKDEGSQINDQQPSTSQITKDRPTATDILTKCDEIGRSEINDVAENYQADHSCSPLLMSSEIDRNQLERPSLLQESSKNAGTGRASNNDELEQTNAELANNAIETGERRIKDQQPSTGDQVTFTSSVHAATAEAASSRCNDNTDAVIATYASQFQASVSHLLMGDSANTTIASGGGKSIRKTELPPQKLHPSTAAAVETLPEPVSTEERMVTVKPLNTECETRPDEKAMKIEWQMTRLLHIFDDSDNSAQDAELTNAVIKIGEKRIKDQQPSTGDQVTSASSVHAKTATLSQFNDNSDVVIPTEASQSVLLGLTPEDKVKTMKDEASCSPVQISGDRTTLTFDGEKGISKTELPPQQLHPSTTAAVEAAAVETLPEPIMTEEQMVDVQLLNSACEMRQELPEMSEMEPMMAAVDNNPQNNEPIEQRCISPQLKQACGRIEGILKVPAILIFGIVLYLLDVGSDIAAGVMYLKEGHPVWGLLTIGFVLLSAVSWATVSATWWYYDNNRDHHPTYRRNRMILSLLFLDPLVRQVRLLWLTCRREYLKCREHHSGDVSNEERRRREDANYSDCWHRKVAVEKSTETFLTAIATLVEDASEITLAMYINIVHGQQESTIGYIQLITSLANIFYTTAQFSQQVRLQRRKENQIKLFSKATVTLLIWRTLIVGSRILIFVLFASLFHYWLFAVVGFHYTLMFALVFYQMRLSIEPPIGKIVYNFITPLVYVFDFCINWLAGPTRYWYLVCYVPMFCENVLMSGLVLWYVRSVPNPAWYIEPGCACAIVMFPLGILVQVDYYRYWHPNVRRQQTELQPTQLSCLSWSKFRKEIKVANRQNISGTGNFSLIDS